MSTAILGERQFELCPQVAEAAGAFEGLGGNNSSAARLSWHVHSAGSRETFLTPV